MQEMKAQISHRKQDRQAREAPAHNAMLEGIAIITFVLLASQEVYSLHLQISFFKPGETTQPATSSEKSHLAPAQRTRLFYIMDGKQEWDFS